MKTDSTTRHRSHEFIAGLMAEYHSACHCDVTVGDEAHWPEEDPAGLFFPVCKHFWTGEQGRPDRNEMFAQVAHDKGGVDIDYNTPSDPQQRATLHSTVLVLFPTDSYPVHDFEV